MKKLILLLLCQIGFLDTPYSQNLSSLPYEVIVDSSTFIIDTVSYNMATYTFTNKSKDDLFLWFEKGACADWNDRKKIKSYFFKTKGDVNLFLMIVEKNILGNAGIVYETFLKKIYCKKSFSVSFVSYNVDTDVFFRNCNKFIENHVVIVAAEKLIEHAGLKNYDTNEIYYNGDFVSLPYKLVSD